MATFSAYSSWPGAPFTESLVKMSLDSLSIPPVFVESPSGHGPLLQWASYDEIDHELTLVHQQNILSSSYVIRKALTRKHFLSRSIHSYVTKNPQSLLRSAIPQTFEIEISFADELQEMLTDELWELGQDLESETPRWWILKPGMADRGNGIRLFNSRYTLEQIFEEFEGSDTEEEEHIDSADNTAVITSQLRHFVVQEYLSKPLLIDPREVSVNGSPIPSSFEGRKFHLRAYCIASGDVEVFLCKRILALFSATAYNPPNDCESIDLSSHLTNTALQKEHGEENVRLLDEIVGCRIQNTKELERFTTTDLNEIIEQMSTILAESFKAALQNPVHFQVLPNAFELFGVDFLVTCTQPQKLKVHLLEFNSEPAIELTGPRLSWILEDLFMAVGKVCVEPFFSSEPSSVDMTRWAIGEARHGVVKCLEEKVHFS